MLDVTVIYILSLLLCSSCDPRMRKMKCTLSSVTFIVKLWEQSLYVSLQLLEITKDVVMKRLETRCLIRRVIVYTFLNVGCLHPVACVRSS
jgi:hypothetical protein